MLPQRLSSVVATNIEPGSPTGCEEEEEEEEEGQADFGPIDNLPMAGGSRSEVCFCLVKIDI